MYDNEPNRASRRSKRLVGAVGLRLAGGIAGGSLAATSSASAAESTASTLAVPVGAPAAKGPGSPADTSTPVRPKEKALTGTEQATAKAAALGPCPVTLSTGSRPMQTERPTRRT